MRIKMLTLIALSAVAFAQGPPPGRGGGRGRMGFDAAAGPGGEFGPGVLRSGVKNAPFTADVVTESSHTLGDGNHIRQTVNSKVYRDSEGRTRREQAFAAMFEMHQMRRLGDLHVPQVGAAEMAA